MTEGGRLRSGHVAHSTLSTLASSPLPPSMAESAIVFAKNLFASTRTYSDQKLCWAPNGARPSLSQIPQLKVSAFTWRRGRERREGGACLLQ